MFKIGEPRVAKSENNDQTANEPIPTKGKGKPTPTRAEQEAARRRPLAPNTKEARKAARARAQEERNRAYAGYSAGDERYLPAREKGPQRRWVRDYVDSTWRLAEFVMPMMILVLMTSIIPDRTNVIALASFSAMLFFMLLSILDLVLLSRRIKKLAATKFGEERMEKGLGWYAARRAMQMRFMRIPKPQVKRGQFPE